MFFSCDEDVLASPLTTVQKEYSSVQLGSYPDMSSENSYNVRVALESRELDMVEMVSEGGEGGRCVGWREVCVGGWRVCGEGRVEMVSEGGEGREVCGVEGGVWGEGVWGVWGSEWCGSGDGLYNKLAWK